MDRDEALLKHIETLSPGRVFVMELCKLLWNLFRRIQRLEATCDDGR